MDLAKLFLHSPRYAFGLLLASVGCLFAQPGSLILSSGATTPGGTVSLNLNFTPSGNQPAGLQWTFIYSEDIVAISVAPGGAATAAGKSISCAGRGGSYTCLAAGVNANTIGGGVLGVMTVTLAPDTTFTSIEVTNTLGATRSGDAYTTSGAGGTIAVSSAANYRLLSLSCSPSLLAR